MILSYAWLICPDHDSIVLATQFSSAQARELLLSTRDASVVADPRWLQSSLGGTGLREADGGAGTEGLYAKVHRLAGVSLRIAPLAGLGSWHEMGTAGDGWRIARDRAAADESLVLNVAEQCRTQRGLPVVAEAPSPGEGRESFEESF